MKYNPNSTQARMSEKLRSKRGEEGKTIFGAKSQKFGVERGAGGILKGERGPAGARQVPWSNRRPRISRHRPEYPEKSATHTRIC
jgi:hypothetical protein